MPFVLLPAWLEVSLVDILQNLKPVPLAIIALLVLASLLSWTIVFSKYSAFGKAKRLNRAFLRAFRKAGNLQAVALASEQFSAAPLVAVFDFGYGEVERQIKQRGALVNKPAIERSLQLGISEEVTKLEMNMSWLATVASVSPFIGLFGTVWGIMDAFVGLGNAGQRQSSRGRARHLRGARHDGGWSRRSNPSRDLLQRVRHHNQGNRHPHGGFRDRVSKPR